MHHIYLNHGINQLIVCKQNVTWTYNKKFWNAMNEMVSNFISFFCQGTVA